MTDDRSSTQGRFKNCYKFIQYIHENRGKHEHVNETENKKGTTSNF